VDVWPIELFAPKAMRWRRLGVANSGGTSASGLNRFSTTDGGGFWVCEMDVDLFAVTKIMAARAVIEGLDGGAGTILVPFIADHEAPYPTGGPAEDVPHSDDTPFSDGTLYAGWSIDIKASAAALRATTLGIAKTASADLIGGEMLSIEYPTKGHHLHTVIRTNEGQTEITIRPPSREAIPDDTVLNFDRPLCAMRLLNATEAMAAIVPPYFSSLTLYFQESFDV
jgi:hypothetical protein